MAHGTLEILRRTRHMQFESLHVVRIRFSDLLGGIGVLHPLQIGQEVGGVSRTAGVLIFRIFDDADNFEVSLMAMAIRAKSLTDWILVPEKFLGESLVDDSDPS